MKQSRKECWINEIIVTVKIVNMKAVLLQSNFETKSKLHINLELVGHAFSID